MNEFENQTETENEEIAPIGDKTALVTIIGRPSAGKSTFLNTATGEQVSIVSAIPQTTRNAIKGIVNTSLGQLVFIDTPGYHDSDKKMNLKMRNIVADQLDNSDLILYIVDSTRTCAEEERLITALLENHQEKIVIAINKIDEKTSMKENTLKFIKAQLKKIPNEKIIEMSAKNDEGINDVLRALYDLAPVAPQLYFDGVYTDQEVDFRIAEVIREQAINRLEKEIPHCIYVKIADMEMKTPSKMWCRAFLCVETDSQKGIVIGKSASMIKTIRVESIKALRKIFDYKIDLDLQVKVDRNWRQKDNILDKLLK